MKSRRFKWEGRSQERQQEVIVATAMEARRKEEERVRDWRRHTTIRHTGGERDLCMVLMG
jgi:hypothetical protein